ncbi:MAG: hypothetical protein ACTS2F_15565 [Thainema sp.]
MTLLTSEFYRSPLTDFLFRRHENLGGNLIVLGFSGVIEMGDYARSQFPFHRLAQSACWPDVRSQPT